MPPKPGKDEENKIELTRTDNPKLPVQDLPRKDFSFDQKEQLLLKPKPIDPGPNESSALFSLAFLSVYLLTSAKSFSNFFYGQNFKEIGMSLIKDDSLITNIALFAGLFNFAIRFSMGRLNDIFGIKMLYLINMGIEMLISLVLIFYGDTFLGFSLFTIGYRMSSGKVFSL